MAQNYFSDLNYSLGNEDTQMEVDILKILKPKKILSIAGCGSRFLPLIAHGPTDAWAIDLADQQLMITRLREELISKLDHKDFLIFMGFAPYTHYDYRSKRRKIFNSLELDHETRAYFDQLLSSNGDGPLLYLGKWERTFATLSKMVRAVFGKEVTGLFEFDQLSDQVDYYHQRFPLKKWKSILYLLGNKTVFDALLYKGDFIRKNVPESHFDYYFNAFEKLFTNVLARQSFFAQLCFFGEIYHEEGNTIEAREDVFYAMKKALLDQTDVHIQKMDLSRVAQDLKGEGLDFLSLSDVPSYFSGELEKNFLQQLKPTLAPGAVVCVRSYLRIPEAIEDGYKDITSRFAQEIMNEKVQMYRVKFLEFQE